MFKENKEMWLYSVGIVILFFVLFIGVRSYLGDSGFDIIGFSSSKKSTPTVLPTSTPQPTLIVKKPDYQLDTSVDYYAEVQTDLGTFNIDLFEKNAPNTVNNFIYLATLGYYEGVSIHRIIPGVLIQTGSRNTLNTDLEDDAYGGPGYVIRDEINWDSLDFDQLLRNQLSSSGYASTATKLASKDLQKYALAMANSGPNTNGSQFFIVLDELTNAQVSSLRGRHTVFGLITSNFELIDQIAKIDVETTGTAIYRPKQTVTIQQVKIFAK